VDAQERRRMFKRNRDQAQMTLSRYAALLASLGVRPSL
jgi:hypothetical protein